jgi:hypothetical protein
MLGTTAAGLFFCFLFFFLDNTNTYINNEGPFLFMLPSSSPPPPFFLNHTLHDKNGCGNQCSSFILMYNTQRLLVNYF